MTQPTRIAPRFIFWTVAVVDDIPVTVPEIEKPLS